MGNPDEGDTPDPPDPVNHPEHYTVGGIETIDFIEAKRLGFCEAQVIKYVSRAEFKSSRLQDLKKAQFYLNRLVEQLDQ